MHRNNPTRPVRWASFGLYRSGSVCLFLEFRVLKRENPCLSGVDLFLGDGVAPFGPGAGLASNQLDRFTRTSTGYARFGTGDQRLANMGNSVIEYGEL